MFHRELKIAIAYRLGLPVNLLNQNHCSMLHCSDFMDKFGDHAISWGSGGDRIYRHIALRDSVFKMLRRVGFDASLEKAGLLDHSNERPGDIFIHTYMTGRPAALDITVSSVVQSSSLPKASQNTGFVVRAAEARKDKKFYEKYASEGIDFIPLAVESLGGWGESALGVFNR